MKRFGLGFMRSISSSSYEVELSDNGSNNTMYSGDLHDSMNTDEGLKSSAKKVCGVAKPFSLNNDSSIHDQSMVMNSISDIDSVQSMAMDESRDEDMALCATTCQANQNEGEVQTSKDLTSCTAQSTKSISYGFSRFLTLCDNTVDVVVDALLPFDDNEKNNKLHTVREGQGAQKTQLVNNKKDNSFKNSIFTRNKKRPKSNRNGTVHSILKSQKDSTTDSLSRRSFLTSNQVIEQQPNVKDNSSVSTSLSSISKFSRGVNSQNKTSTKDGSKNKSTNINNRSSSFKRTVGIGKQSYSARSFNHKKNISQEKESPVVLNTADNHDDLNVCDCFFTALNVQEKEEIIVEKKPKKKRRLIKFRKNNEEKKTRLGRKTRQSQITTE